jgi:thiaminase
MSQLRLSTSINDSHGPGKTLHVRIFDLLLSALNNIQREMQFFEDTAKEYKLDLDLEAEMDDVTRMYVQCFDAVKSGSGAGGLIEGLTVLWATEHCYLTAWTHAKSHMKDSAAVDELSSATRALHTAFIPNWTCPEFLDFVNQCADVLNVVAAAEGLGKVSEPGTSAKKDVLTRCEHVWKQVLYLEERFWPQV